MSARACSESLRASRNRSKFSLHITGEKGLKMGHRGVKVENLAYMY